MVDQDFPANLAVPDLPRPALLEKNPEIITRYVVDPVISPLINPKFKPLAAPKIDSDLTAIGADCPNDATHGATLQGRRPMAEGESLASTAGSRETG